MPRLNSSDSLLAAMRRALYICAAWKAKSTRTNPFG
jgi:hypothetical protein